MQSGCTMLIRAITPSQNLRSALHNLAIKHAIFQFQLHNRLTSDSYARRRNCLAQRRRAAQRLAAVEAVAAGSSAWLAAVAKQQLTHRTPLSQVWRECKHELRVEVQVGIVLWAILTPGDIQSNPAV